MRSTAAFCALACAMILAAPAHAFCGFFVGKADSGLFNKSSQVAIVRDGDRTVITMGNDFRGEATDFALVVPVPSVLTRDQIHVGERALLERLDAYSAPRLVEYNDPDPCFRDFPRAMAAAPSGSARKEAALDASMAGHALGVKVEASYTVGEYDIVLLSAKESGGLETWLRQSGYRIPARAAAALAPYVRQSMKFFVARVNLKEHGAGGYQQLRPIQIAFESPRFMLPIRLGMANAEGPQDLVIYAMTRKGRVESSNYQTVKMPGDAEVPEFVQQQFGEFYKAAFDKSWRDHGGRALTTEYVWNMSSCDPCASQPLTQDELRQLGVFWLDEQPQLPQYSGRRPMMMPVQPVTLTRLHVRYDSDRFPEDLMFQETGDQQPFQARYIVRHPFHGSISCSAGSAYQEQVAQRRRAEMQTLASLTGWEMDRIRGGMGGDAPAPHHDDWWKRLWK